MGRKRRMKERVRCMLYDKPKLNRKLACIKKSLDEVIHILNPHCKC